MNSLVALDILELTDDSLTVLLGLTSFSYSSEPLELMGVRSLVVSFRNVTSSAAPGLFGHRRIASQVAFLLYRWSPSNLGFLELKVQVSVCVSVSVQGSGFVPVLLACKCVWT